MAAESPSESDPRRWLSGPALDLYQHLEATGQVQRLKEMPQLGAVAWIHPQVKHTRWDYVALLLRLSACVADLDEPFGDMGELEIEGRPVGTPCQLLQCWAMLQNLGHLWGTFATERSILNALLAPGTARTLFLEGMTTQPDQAFAEYVLGHYLLFKVNWALATGFLHTLPQHQGAPGRDAWLAMLRAYRWHEDYGTGIDRLYFAQRRLRRLAYVHLDLANANLPVVTDMTAVERDPARYLNGFLWRDEDPLNTVLEHVHRYIPSEIYYAPDAVLVHRLLELRAGAQVRRDLNAAKSAHELFTILEAMKREEAWPVVAEVVQAFKRRDYVHLHRMGETRSGSVAKDEWNAQLHRLQSRFERALNAHSLVHVNVPGDRTERWTDFYVHREIESADLARTLTVICRQIAQLPAPSGRSLAPQPCQGAQVSDLVTRVLSLMLRDTQRVRVKEYAYLAGDASFLLVDSRSEEWARRQIQSLLATCEAASRRHELEVLATSLRERPADGFRIVMLGGFQVERRAENSPGDAEFDGAYIDLKDDGATLYLVEAKSTLDSPAAARQLRRRLRRLGWLEGSQVVPMRGGAEAAVPIWLRGCCPQPARVRRNLRAARRDLAAAL